MNDDLMEAERKKDTATAFNVTVSTYPKRLHQRRLQQHIILQRDNIRLQNSNQTVAFTLLLLKMMCLPLYAQFTLLSTVADTAAYYHSPFSNNDDNDKNENNTLPFASKNGR